MKLSTILTEATKEQQCFEGAPVFFFVFLFYCNVAPKVYLHQEV